MTEPKNVDVLNTASQEDQKENNRKLDSEIFRQISYVIIFIGTIFIINAMETGSYRTPWPVAVLTALAGVGLFGYSRYLQSRNQ